MESLRHESETLEREMFKMRDQIVEILRHKT